MALTTTYISLMMQLTVWTS